MLRKNSSIECKCPKCGSLHRMNLYWVGRGKPRKYCRNCKNGVTSISYSNIYPISQGWMGD